MHFGNPTVLYGLFALPFVVLFFVWVFKRKKRLLSRLGSWDLVQRLIDSTSRSKQVTKVMLLIIAIGLLLFSMSRPQYGSIERPIRRKGVDIFIAIDTSVSMLAQDIKPNRLARAKEQLKGLIHRLRGDRVGIITFAGTAFVQCPLTLDYGLAQNILDTVEVDSVPVQGTAIGTAIHTATKAFERSAKGEKVLVLLTDGEDHDTDPIGAAKQAAKEGIKIYSIGIGSEKGEPIRLPDGSFKQDTEGHTVNSRLDLALLQKLAQITGGKTIKANPKGSLELDAIYSDIGLIQKKPLRSRTYTIYEERFQYFLLPVILLLIIDMLMSDRKRTVQKVATLMLIIPFLFGFKLTDSLSNLTHAGNVAYKNKKFDKALEFYKNAQVESPEAPELHFNIGNVLLGKKKYDEAIKEYERASAIFKDPARMAAAHYNIGVAQYRTAQRLASMGKLPDAIKKLGEAMASNQLAMKRNPTDPDPKFNYEQCKRLLKQLMEKMKKQEQKGTSPNKTKAQNKQAEKEKKAAATKEKKEQKKKAEKKPEGGKNQKTARQKQKKVKVGEMSKEDALRLLSTLPKENRNALKEALKRQYGSLPGTGKDW